MTPRQLQLRDEILQVLFWLRGEELGEEAGIAELSLWIATEGSELEPVLSQMVRDGLLLHGIEEGTFGATELGTEEGGRRFTEDFADAGLGAQGHGECGPGCDCSKHGPDGCSHHHSPNESRA